MDDPARDAIERAVAALRRGDLVGMPTETVYGLAADAANPAAVRRIFALKGRPANHPLIVHVADAAALERWSRVRDPRATALAAAFWPGPLTMILPRAAQVPDEVTGGQDSVGLRCPDHPVALALLRAFGGGVAAPSANRFGRVSPTSAAHVREEFPEGVAVVLEGGDCAVGIESTIVDLCGATPRILRPGRISAAQLAQVIGPVEAGPTAASPRASGTLEAHYAPSTALLMMARPALLEEATRQQALGKRVRLLAVGSLPAPWEGLALPASPTDYAHGLYAALRGLDAQGVNLLLVETPPEAPGWEAIHDRLRRSAAGAAPAEAEDGT